MPASVPVPLDQFGDVLTDEDLARVVGRGLTWPRHERHMARRLGEPPNLPPSIGGFFRRRYHKDDVAAWMRSGGRRAARRAS